MELSHIDHLNRQAWEARINDSLEACKMAEEALDFAEKEGYKKGMADANRTKGFCLIRFSKHKDAYSCLETARNIYEELEDIRGLAPLYEYYGIINRSWGDFRAAVEDINKAIELSRESDFIENEMTNHYQLGVTYRALGEYEQALESLDRSLSLAKKLNHGLMKGYVINVMGSIYFKTENYHKALEYYQEGLELRKKSGDQWGVAGSLDNVGMTYLQLEELDKAIESCNYSLNINRKVGDKKGEGNSLMFLSQIHLRQEEYQKAISFGEQCQKIRAQLGDKKGEAEVLIQISKITRLSKDVKDFDASNLDRALQIIDEIGAKDLKSEIYKEYYLNYKSNGNYKESIEYLEKYLENEKLLHKDSIDQKIRNLEISHKVEESKKETELFRLKNIEIQEQKNQLEKTLKQLKEMQTQLIQSEKMASLGELTAGIAHEIKNPLNFVNNFSDVNSELIDEMLEELNLNNLDEVIEIANDIKSNEEKIKHHGKRADSIVKNMLMHSRNSTGEMEEVDINALADEYLRMAYHGLRAKEKLFNSAMETYLDDSIGKIKVIPQDFGRVLLNLITNAFQAVNERQKKGEDGYSPMVTIASKHAPLEGNDSDIEDSQRGGRGVIITVQDNGNGIPEEIKDKIFQPFFTTKPTGEGTGLGLSMSYDIITKGHGGRLRVASEEGVGTTFVIEIPSTK